ncbi:MAG: hypothetical protein ACR2LV_09260 [Solirubrobacteraceae bacterium]
MWRTGDRWGAGAFPGARSSARARARRRGRPGALALLCALVGFAAWPGVAGAHGPVAPVASSYLARVNQAPPGTEARVIDGDLRMWLRVSTPHTVIVLG